MKEELAGYALNQEKQFSQYAVNQEKQLAQHAQSQDKQFAQFYLRSLYGVLGVAILLVGSSWILPMNETKRLEAEIMRRVVIREGMENVTELIRGRTIVPEGVEKEPKGK